MPATTVVPKEVALKLCADIRAENRRRPLSIAAGQCWGCVKFSKGDKAKMCGGIVGCNLVVARYARESRQRDK
jgi:hypothetical protein